MTRLQRYDVYIDYRCELPTQASKTGRWVKASDAEAMEKRVDRLQKVLSDVADFANAHDLPCLEDIVRQVTEIR
jgi:hypothetical protein